MTFVSYETKILIFMEIITAAFIFYYFINRSSVTDYQLKINLTSYLFVVLLFLSGIQRQVDKIRSNPNVNQM